MTYYASLFFKDLPSVTGAATDLFYFNFILFYYDIVLVVQYEKCNKKKTIKAMKQLIDG